MVGRTHGIHAEPTTLGAKLALWCLQADRDRGRLLAARDAVAVGKLSGAVGTYSNIDPAVEAHVCTALGWQPTRSNAEMLADSYDWFLANRAHTADNGRSHHRTTARQGALTLLKAATRLLPR